MIYYKHLKKTNDYLQNLNSEMAEYLILVNSIIR